MSGIFGVVDFENKIDSSRMSNWKSIVETSYKNYKIDRFNHIQVNNVYMSSSMQITTKENESEILPFKNIDGSVCTADAIIYNRDELINEFDIKDIGISDSSLIVEGYKRYGESVSKHLIGDYAFAIWNNEKQELYLSRDHVGKQCIYYYFENGILIFSTIIKTIVETLRNFNIDVYENEKWIANFLALEGMVNEYDVGETPYENIFIVKPAEYITFTKLEFNKKIYWNPREVRSLKLNSHKEYINKFLEIFNEAVNCRLRTTEKVAVQISGGLDSTSVAAIASKILSKESKDLLGYNFSPMPEYSEELPKYLVANEMEFVDELVKMYPNFKVKSTYCKNKNSIRNAKEFLDILEQPYRIVENLYWGVELSKMAKADGCNVMLNGQYGNCTISFGDFISLGRNILTHNPIRFYKELHRYSKSYKSNKRIVLKNTISSIRNSKKDNNVFKNRIINKDLIKKYNLETIYKRKRINLSGNLFPRLENAIDKIVSPVGLSHLGVVETKVSLYTGVIIRDPTRDKRIIEFCLSIPDEEYIKDGVDRRLIRESMAGILPNFIRLNHLIRGMQSADWVDRLYLDKEYVDSEINKLLKDNKIYRYIDIDSVFSNIEKGHLDVNKKLKGNEIKRILISIIFNYYFNDKIINIVDLNIKN